MNTATAARSKLINRDATASALRLIVADQVTEVRCLNAWDDNPRWTRTFSGYFDDFGAAARELSKLKGAKGVYFVLNPVQPDLIARAANRLKVQEKGAATSDSNIVSRRWLPVDLDAIRPSGISANDSEHEAAIAKAREIMGRLTAKGWPQPILGDSGNGAHLLYRIDVPADDDGLIQRVLEALAGRFDDDTVKVDRSVFNPARIWKLYGSRACKGDDTTDRPHRMASILSAPQELAVVGSELLEALAGPTDTGGVKLPESGSSPGSKALVAGAFDIDGFITRHKLDVSEPSDWNGGRVWNFRTSPLCDHHGDGPFLMQLASGALKASCKHDSCSWAWADLRQHLEPREAKPSGQVAASGTSMSHPQPATPRALTDLGNGERFAAQFGARVRYVPTWNKWYVWDGRRWQPDELGEVMRLAKQAAKSIHVEAALAEDDDVQEAIGKFAMKSQGRSALESMLALARSEPPIAASHSGLDADPWLLNCENGTVDLRTGELRPHDPGDLITKSTGTDYFDGAGWEAPLWHEFLATTFADDADLIGFVQRLFGVGLIGEQLEHVFPILWGGGANGKSVFTGAVQNALGDYAITAAPGLFTVKRGETHPTELADLHGRRLVVLNETQDGARLNEGLIKSITGGDTIKARRMREDYWQFPPSHLAALVTNHKPVVSGSDYGIWRRLRLIPFTVTIPAEQQDRELPNKLRAEAPGILRWAVEGCLAWRRDGLSEPEVVKAATSGYQAESDVVGRWLEECCVVDLKAEARSAQLLHSYNAWAAKVHERDGSQRWLGIKLGEKGFTKVKGREGVKYVGVGLLTDRV